MRQLPLAISHPKAFAPSRTFKSLRIGAQAQAAGAVALGALAVGALELGAVAIGRLAIGRARIRRVEIDELVARKLRVAEQLRAPAKADSQGPA